MRLATLTLLLATLTALAVSGGPEECRSRCFIKQTGLRVLCELPKGHGKRHKRTVKNYGVVEWDGGKVIYVFRSK